MPRFPWLDATTLALAACLSACFSALPAQAETRQEYRGFWVDTFNTSLNNHSDVVAAVDEVEAANANAIFAQVRRRGDSWYLNSLEPLADRTSIEPGFDPLQDLIGEAHRRHIQVHAFVIVGAVWNRDPTLFPPEDSNHVFNQHGFNQATGDLYEGRDNWLTRTLLSDQGTAISWRGHRFGPEFWIEPGHPDAAAYTVDVLLHLVANYDIDGLHLDRIRYPELSIPGQTPDTGANIGYNETNVARFQRRYDIDPGSPPPDQNDPLWSQWRRDQVGHLVRRVYLNAIAIKPQLAISAALIAFGDGPTTEASWLRADAYWRVYQDWRAWTEEGILDLAIPMNYKAEHTVAGRTAFDHWTEWAKGHAFDRWVLSGQAAYLNAIEGTLRQTRRALAPSEAGQPGRGVVFFSKATTNAAVAANPFAIPPGRNTPTRLSAEFASGLTTGQSTDGSEVFEDPAAFPVPIFAEPAAVPPMPWKVDPRKGHAMGFITWASREAVDEGDVVIIRADGRCVSTTTDGGGFYGAVDLDPGDYVLTVTPHGGDSYTMPAFTIAPGQVTRFDVVINP